ncbi:MAG: oligoribonuclease [Polyangiaceae bacterium]|nr:oligoribonuclease [Polyangiaceae bacterium]
MSADRFVWIDLEMTGLDPERDVVLEIAAIVTGPELEPLEELERVIWQPEEALARMTPFVRQMHDDNGLAAKVRASRVDLAQAEREVLAMVTRHAAFRAAYLAGNTIYQDRRFLTRHMPQLEGYLHYRQVDVSSLKVLVQAWYPDARFDKPGKTHTALDDIRDSLAELRHYRARVMR